VFENKKVIKNQLGIISKDGNQNATHPLAKLEILISNNKESSRAFLNAFVNQNTDLGIDNKRIIEGR